MKGQHENLQGSDPGIMPAPGYKWLVYIILASDDSLYTGITNNMMRRWMQHTGGTGARFFYGRKPVDLLYLESCNNRSSASRREAAIKKLSRRKKLLLLNDEVNQLEALKCAVPLLSGPGNTTYF